MKIIKLLFKAIRYLYRNLRFYLITLPCFLFISKKLNIKGRLVSRSIILKDIPVEKFRVGWFHKATGDTVNPLCLASKLYVQEKNFEDIVDLFDNFRKHYRLNSANDLFGLDGSVFNKSESIFKSGFPWDEASFDKIQKMRVENICHENSAYGLNTYCYFGSESCSYQKAEVEAKRTAYLIDDIDKNGYNFYKNNDVVTITLLRDRQNYVALVGGGNHRVAALAAGFNYKNIDAKLNNVVNRVDVKNWKHVKNGAYTEEQALRVFDAIMSATPPKAFGLWEVFLKNKNNE